MSVNGPLVSVYVTNHNYASYIEQAIASVLSQTLQDYELIVIDDGSTDNSREIIERYAEHDKIVTIFQQNQGLTVTNNIALRQARGKYIVRLDADDWLDEHALQVMSGVLEREDDVGLVFPDYYHVDKNGQVSDVVRRHNFDEVELLDQPAHGACTMIRRQCLLELEGYDETIDCQDGWDLWIRLIQRYRVKNVNLPLFYYRKHGNSLSGNERRLLDTRQRILAKYAAQNGQALKGTAIVPIRGAPLDPGSIALRQLDGKLLVDWTLDAALGSQRLENIIVTTPDDAIIEHVQNRYGNRVLTVRRDSQFAMPNTAIEDTVFDAIETHQARIQDAAAIVTLYVECPFRTARHIDSAFDVLELFDADSVIGVRPEMDDFYQHDGGGLVPMRRESTLRLEREELFRSVGQIYLVRREFLDRERAMTGGRVGHVVIDERSALYLNSEWNWEIAEFTSRQIASELEEAELRSAS